jgi:hypothetical protein
MAEKKVWDGDLNEFQMMRTGFLGWNMITYDDDDDVWENRLIVAWEIVIFMMIFNDELKYPLVI